MMANMKKALFALLLVAIPAVAGDQRPGQLWWPQFLGPQRNGMSTEKNLNTDWKKAPPKVLWKVPLGDGFSSFAIVGDRAFTLCERAKRSLVVCLDCGNGKELWAQDVAQGYVDKQKQGIGPRSTPRYHDGRLYCLLPMGELVCVSALDGKIIWSADQFKDTGAVNPAGAPLYWGVAISPFVEGDLVIVQPGGKNNNSVAAYHKDTGKLVWTAGNDPAAYGSPLAVTIGGTRQLIVPTGQSVLGIEPTKGTVLWRYPMGRENNTTCATPVWTDGVLWVSAAYGVGSGVLEINGQGGAWTVKEKWRDKKNLQTLYSNAMIVDGYVYACHGDIGAVFMKCLDFKTGEIKWERRLDNRHWLLAFDGHILSWNETGTLQLFDAKPEAYEVKAELPNLLTRKSWAAPGTGEWAALSARSAECFVPGLAEGAVRHLGSGTVCSAPIHRGRQRPHKCGHYKPNCTATGDFRRLTPGK